MKFRKNPKQDFDRREGATSYKKQQSFHYSAHRSNSERTYGRREYSESDQPRPDNLLKAKILKYSPSIIAFGAIIIGLFYLLHVAPSVTIRTVGDKPFIGDDTALQQKAAEIINSSPLNRVKLTFDKSKLEDELTANFPQYTDVRVDSYLFRQRPVVTVEIAEPTLLLTNGNRNYIVSQDGTVLADITDTKPAIDTTALLLIQDQTEVPITVGKVALTADQVKYILQMKYQTETKGLEVESAVLIPGGGELHVRYGGLPYYVKYNLYEDARRSTGTFLATREDLAKRGMTPKEYVDVRIPERAYIR